MNFSSRYLSKIVTVIDFTKLFEDNKIEVRKSRKNDWVNCNCPFCTAPKDTHFNGGFSNIKPAFNCWRCGKHWWKEAVALLFNITPIAVDNLVKNYSFISKNENWKKVAQGKNLQLPGYTDMTKAEKLYLHNRGFNLKQLQKQFGIRGGGIAGDWSYRIIIPIFYKGRLVSWTGRSILDREFIKQNNIPRYKNLSIEQSEISPKDIFFNLDNSRNDSVIIVEGPMDVLKMGNNCICSLGTSVTEAQKLLLLERYKNIYIAFDNEESAQHKAKKLAFDLSIAGVYNVEVVNICEDFGKNDPGELNENEVKAVKKELGFYE